MHEKRRYQRYTLDKTGDAADQFTVIVEGEIVELIDFSIGGLYVISKIPFSMGTISFSVRFANKGEISLTGNVVRVKEEGRVWGIAIDLSKSYRLSNLRKT